jgi:probable HAF family extracellular repeat protein
MTRRPSLGVLAALLLAPLAQAQFVSFSPVPTLPGGTNLSRARAVSGDGLVVVGMSNSANGDEAMRWVVAAPGAGGLGDLPGGPFSSDAFACSVDGSIVFGAGTDASGNNEAYRWTAAGGMVSLGFLPTGGYVSRAFGCNDDGTQACGENLFQPTGVPPPLPITQAFRWTQSGGMQGLGFLPGSTSSYSTARAMSNNGSVVVGWAEGADLANHPFVWTQAAGMQQIGAFPGTARGISPSGNWVVGSDSSTSQAFRWSQATGVQELGILPGRTSAIAVAISDDGATVLGVCNGGAGQVAAVWTEGLRGYNGCGSGWTTIADYLAAHAVSTSGWSLNVVLGMDLFANRIVGYGVNPSGQTQAWTATIRPQPMCGSADFNCDGDVGTDADIESFFACIAGTCPAPPCCSDADFNNDGDYGTDADIEAFFRVLSETC